MDPPPQKQSHLLSYIDKIWREHGSLTSDNVKRVEKIEKTIHLRPIFHTVTDNYPLNQGAKAVIRGVKNYNNMTASFQYPQHQFRRSISLHSRRKPNGLEEQNRERPLLVSFP